MIIIEKYRTKPCEIEAVQWNGDNLDEIIQFADKKNLMVKFKQNAKAPELKIKTLEGNMEASVNDYIIRGLRGEYYPCKPDVFEKKYELIKE